MAIHYKVLGQSVATANQDVQLYAVPTGKESIVSTLAVSNRGADDQLFSVRIRVAGAANDNKQYVVYQVPCASNSAVSLNLSMTLSAGDLVMVNGASTDLSFNLFGSEVDA